ncbi:hypothetical protein, partial [Streptococcus dysgalactiae]|uniref:hypothetical protein n=1 Tax=Streptococcus dysgalactiae TaxID=1334 RepID=UPI00165306C7
LARSTEDPQEYLSHQRERQEEGREKRYKNRRGRTRNYHKLLNIKEGRGRERGSYHFFISKKAKYLNRKGGREGKGRRREYLIRKKRGERGKERGRRGKKKKGGGKRRGKERKKRGERYSTITRKGKGKEGRGRSGEKETGR